MKGAASNSPAGQIEFEARFVGVDLAAIKQQLADHRDIVCDYPRTLLRRYILAASLASGDNGYLRLRSGEFGRTFLTLKSATGSSGVDAFKEITVEVDDEAACLLLFGELGHQVLRYQETYREQWRWDSILFDLDEWPGLPPFLEIEATNAEDVATGAKLLGLSMNSAEFDNVADTYRKHTGRDILAEARLVF